MSVKQDRVKARTPTDVERRYGLKPFAAGFWKPTLNIKDISYTVQQGWYQKIGNVVTIGWNIEGEVKDNSISIPINITGVPCMPCYEAFGGGVAQNVVAENDLPFEGWGIDSRGIISGTTTVFSPFSGEIKLGGTICYTV